MQTPTISSPIQIDTAKVLKSEEHVIIEIVDYIPSTIVSKTVIKNKGGRLSVVSFDLNEEFCETTTKFDTYVQIIEGKAEVTINDDHFKLELGENIIIPANSVHCFVAHTTLK
jgi:quercetin dioxygenase-like cupin family protein